MTDIERLGQSVQMLVNGWSERIEYKVRINDVIEARAKSVRHNALLAQLHEAALHGTSNGSSNGGSTNKPGSRPPLNMAPLNLVDSITEQAQYHYHSLCTMVNAKPPSLMRKRPVIQTLHHIVVTALNAHEYPQEVREVTRAAQMWVRKSRVMLGYEKPHVLLKDTVCGTCGGALVVASDASSDVRCIGTNAGPSCGQVYPRYQWLDLMQ